VKLNDKKLLIPLLLLLNIFLASVILFIYSATESINASKIITADNKHVIPSLPKELSEKFNVSSRAYIIYDPESRTTLLGKNEKLRFAPASAAKIMTAIIALEYYDLNQVLTARNVYEVDGSKMKLVEGEQIAVKNLLYGLMLPSGNDAAHVIAQSFPGGKEAFVEKMNEKAKELGLSNTPILNLLTLQDTMIITIRQHLILRGLVLMQLKTKT
jgi:D-alanyl-D-alanine carboxypeptidase